MPDRINHVAVWVAAIVYWLFGWLWYSVFGAAWMAAMGGKPSTESPINLLWSFILGLVLAYATGMALSRHPGDQTLQQGVSFALFMGIALFATQTLNQVLFAGTPMALWLINTGYVVVGFAIMGAIIGGWKKRVAATA